MEFKVEITDEHIKMAGKGGSLLAGLSLYVIALRENGIDEEVITGAFAVRMEENINKLKSIHIKRDVEKKNIKGRIKGFF